MAVRVLTRTGNKGQQDSLKEILKALGGDDDPNDLTNIDTIFALRKKLYDSGVNFVIKLITMARAFERPDKPDLIGPHAADARALFDLMFANLDFRREPFSLTAEQQRQVKADHIQFRKGPFVTKILSVTAELASAGFGKTIDNFAERFLQLPFQLFGVDLVSYSGTKREQLVPMLQDIYQAGHAFYETTLEPEISIDRIFPLISEVFASLTKDIRGCKRAKSMLLRSEDLFKANIKNYIRECKLQGNVFAIFEMFVADIQENAVGAGAPCVSEFSSILVSIRRTINSKMAGVKQQNVNRVLDMVDGLINSVNSAEARSGEELLRESEAARAALLDFLSQ
jgi:hypothetical protein